MKNKKIRSIGLFIICAAFLALAVGCGAKEQAAEPQEEVQEESVETEQEDPEQEDESEPEEVADPAILAETEDAGQEYIDEMLFLGDSNTARYLQYNYVSLDNSIGIVGMGAGSITTLQCAQFSGYSKMLTLTESMSVMQPKRVFIGFGTNNLMGDVDKFIVSYQNGIKAMIEEYPYFDVIVNAIPPIASKCSYKTVSMEAVHEFNDALIRMCEENGWKFCNTIEALEDPETGFARTGYTDGDGLHLSEAGVEALFMYIRTHALDTEDRRPALAEIPKHQEAKQKVIKKDPLKTGVSDANTFVEQNKKLLEEAERRAQEEAERREREEEEELRRLEEQERKEQEEAERKAQEEAAAKKAEEEAAAQKTQEEAAKKKAEEEAAAKKAEEEAAAKKAQEEAAKKAEEEAAKKKAEEEAAAKKAEEEAARKAQEEAERKAAEEAAAQKAAEEAERKRLEEEERKRREEEERRAAEEAAQQQAEAEAQSEGGEE